MRTLKPEVDLQKFLTRPYIISTYSWVSTNALGTALPNIQLPRALTSASSSLLFKLENIAYLRPDIEVEIQLNATRFHYGRLAFALIPLQGYLAPNYVTAQNWSTWPQWYQISAGAEQSVKFVVPFKFYYNAFMNTRSDPAQYSAFNLQGYVSAPLLGAMTATPAAVTVNIFARFIDPGCSGYTNGASALSGDNTEALKLMSLNTTTFTNSPISKIVTPITDMVKDTTAVAKDLVHLGHLAGMSTPANPNVTNPMQIRQPLWTKAEDAPASINLGPSLSASLDNNLSNANSHPADMDFVHYVSQPSLRTTISLASTAAVGSLIWSQYLSPISMIYTDTVWTPAAQVFQPLPAYALARMFAFWRGSFRVHVSFVASAFHSVRARFMWDPQGNISSPYTINQQSNVYNCVMDINEQTDYSFVLPYYQAVPWMTCDGPAAANLKKTTNGTFAIVLMSNLTSISATVQPITIQIFMSMCDDAQFAAPLLRNINAIGNPYIGDPPAVLSLLSDDSDNTDDDIVAQSGETVGVNTKECQLPSSSSTCLRSTPHNNIMGGDFVGERLYGISTSFEFSSFKQLASLLSPIARHTTVEADALYGWEFNPFGNINTVAWNSDNFLSYYVQVRCLFRWGRGSVRMTGITDHAGVMVTSHLYPGGAPQVTWLKADVENPFNGLLAGMTSGFQLFVDTTVMPADVIIPYYSNTPCRPLNSGATNITTYDFGTSAGLVWHTGGAAGITIILSIAAGDDFIFGDACGVPYFKKNA